MKPLRLPAAHARPLMSSLRGSVCFSAFVLAVSAPGAAKPTAGPRSICSAGAPSSGCFAYGHRQDLSGFLATHPAPLPCSKTPAEPVDAWPFAAFPMLPPDPTRRRLQRLHDFEAATGLRCPLSTLHERRCRRPCKTRFRLAGSAFAGRASNPLGRVERFQATSILLSRTYPDASWAHMRRPFYDFYCPRSRRLPPRCWRASASSTRSRPTSAVTLPTTESRCGRSEVDRSWKPCMRGCRLTSAVCPPSPTWRRPSATQYGIGPAWSCSSTMAASRWTRT